MTYTMTTPDLVSKASYFGFGQTVYSGSSPTSEYFVQFTCGTSTSSTCSDYVLFDISQQGLILPEVFYDEWISLWDDIQVTSCTDDDAGICTVNTLCNNIQEDLDNYQFKLQFDGQDNYVLVPLSVFTVSNPDGKCDIMIQKQNQYTSNPNAVVVGGLFFQ